MPSLHTLRRRVVAAGGGSLLPYIYQQYNMKDYHAGTGFSGISRMIHPLVQALNEKSQKTWSLNETRSDNILG